jgi:hypothetical protein
MTYENFLKVILQQQKSDRVISEAYKLNIDLLEFVDPYHHIISTLIKEIYGEEGYDWYSWFCYENDYGTGTLTANEADGTPICYSHESLWEELEKNHLIINKEKTDVMKETQEKFISLYDYVGHKDNEGYGKVLYDYAVSQGVKPKIREISNPMYKGKVMLYPKSTIENFFKFLTLQSV